MSERDKNVFVYYGYGVQVTGMHAFYNSNMKP